MPRTFDAVVLRQDGPQRPSYWERHTVAYEADMNCISLLQKIAAGGRTAEGQPVAPVAWDCNCLEEVCGACTMVINGRVRQACTALVDKLLAERQAEIELRPMSKFPVIRDLVVDRSRMFETMKKIEAWLPVNSYDDLGPGTRQSQEQQELSYVLSRCMTCGCCLEACPQYLKIELAGRPDESEEEFRRRERAQSDRSFMGAFAIALVEHAQQQSDRRT